jgi:hypothetical protein
MNRGSTGVPRLANVVKAATRSSGCTAEAPIALDGYGAMRELIPILRASAAMESIPSRRPSCTATPLRDRASASLSES